MSNIGVLSFALVLAASSLLAQEQAMQCTSPGRVASIPVIGPGDSIAILLASTHDDWSKDSHMCQVDYELYLSTSEDVSTFVSVNSVIGGAWERRLAVRLDGFSADGKRVFGIYIDGAPFEAILFGYNVVTKKVDMEASTRTTIGYSDQGQRRDTPGLFKQGVQRKCGHTFSIIGTTDKGALVFQQRRSAACPEPARWVLEEGSHAIRPLPADEAIVPLYQRRA